MKRILTSLVVLAALTGTAALADSPAVRQMHDFDALPMNASRYETPAYTGSETAAEPMHHGKHHHHKHEGMHHHKHEGKHDGAKHHHHHHHMGKDKAAAAPAPAEAPKQ